MCPDLTRVSCDSQPLEFQVAVWSPKIPKCHRHLLARCQQGETAGLDSDHETGRGFLKDPGIKRGRFGWFVGWILFEIYMDTNVTMSNWLILNQGHKLNWSESSWILRVMKSIHRTKFHELDNTLNMIQYLKFPVSPFQSFNGRVWMFSMVPSPYIHFCSGTKNGKKSKA